MRTTHSIVFAATLVLVACERAPAEPPSSPTTTALPAPPTAAPTPAATAEASRPAQVGARHVLVMHRGSSRVPEGITRSRDEARTRAEDVLRRARAGEDFAALARQFSDEPGAAERAGDLGVFGAGQMVPPFERAAFALPVNGLSDIVETDFGFHVIKRTQ